MKNHTTRSYIHLLLMDRMKRLRVSSQVMMDCEKDGRSMNYIILARSNPEEGRDMTEDPSKQVRPCAGLGEPGPKGDPRKHRERFRRSGFDDDTGFARAAVLVVAGGGAAEIENDRRLG